MLFSPSTNLKLVPRAVVSTYMSLRCEPVVNLLGGELGS